ncbi:MAG TPA: hypothetical protein VL463_03995 [Kofleriaceae bacterium]|nr:hypothetical protein [Kofleriaceae bacterium]
MSEDEPATPSEPSSAPAGNPGVLVGILIALAAVALRACDASREAELSNAVAGAGLGGRGGASPLGAFLLYIVVAAAIVLFVRWAFREPKRAIPIVVIASLVTGILICTSIAPIARRRSKAVDSWSLCERPGVSPSGYSTYVSSYKHRPMFGGPHLANGEPCVSTTENRDVHKREHPDGDVLDGLHQILYRFPDDMGRAILGPAALVLLLVLAIAITLVHERRRTARPPLRRRPSTTPDSGR